MENLTLEVLTNRINIQISTNLELIKKFRKDFKTEKDVDMKVKIRYAISTLQKNNRILKNLLK